jgi:hypothetical protein
MQPGTLVHITREGQMGTLAELDGQLMSCRFDGDVTIRGGTGKDQVYVGPHHSIPDWHILEVETSQGKRYCPLPEDWFEESYT